MVDTETNLHPKNNPSINLKPNIVSGNIPDKAVTFKQLEENLQNKINSHSFQIAKNTADIAKNTADIDDEASTRESGDERIREEVFQYVDNINSNLEEKISTNKTDIAKNTADIGSLTSKVSNLESDNNTNKTDIAKNTADIEKNTADIEKQNQRALLLPSSAPSTRKVVTIDTNGKQDNIDPTELPTLMENIVDSHGNKRFAEGNITMKTIEGITQTYGKWSLSGTHLMVVLAAKIANGTELVSNTILATVNLPSYIFDKIVALWSNIAVDSKIINARADDWTIQSFNCAMLKTNYIELNNTSNVTLTADRSFRIQFDLLIDSD